MTAVWRREPRSLVSVFEIVIAMMTITIGARGIVPILARRRGGTVAHKQLFHLA